VAPGVRAALAFAFADASGYDATNRNEIEFACESAALETKLAKKIILPSFIHSQLMVHQKQGFVDRKKFAPGQ
jgi:hypothetical protein